MRARLALVVGTTAVALAACGGGSSDSAEQPVDTTSAPAAGSSADEPDAEASPTTTADTGAEAASTDDGATSADGATSDAPPAVEVPEILQFTSSLVGGGELDAATTAGTPTAFWFWAPT